MTEDQPADAERAGEVADLFERLRELRLALTTDLSAAAGALDDGQPVIARDIIDGNQRAVRRLQSQ